MIKKLFSVIAITLPLISLPTYATENERGKIDENFFSAKNNPLLSGGFEYSKEDALNYAYPWGKNRDDLNEMISDRFKDDKIIYEDRWTLVISQYNDKRNSFSEFSFDFNDEGELYQVSQLDEYDITQISRVLGRHHHEKNRIKTDYDAKFYRDEYPDMAPVYGEIEIRTIDDVIEGIINSRVILYSITHLKNYEIELNVVSLMHFRKRFPLAKRSLLKKGLVSGYKIYNKTYAPKNQTMH